MTLGGGCLGLGAAPFWFYKGCGFCFYLDPPMTLPPPPANSHQTNDLQFILDK